MFLTLDSARKLLAIAFYGLLTFNSVVWAQITPVPGGLSSISSSSSLSSSTPASKSKAAAPAIEPKSHRPLLALRPDAELPPVPPAASINAGKASVAKAAAAKTESGSGQVKLDPQHDRFMSELESELTASAPSKDGNASIQVTKNSAINPAQAKSLVVQASATGEVPPVPPPPQSLPAQAKTAAGKTSAAVLPPPKTTEPIRRDEPTPANDELIDIPAAAAQATLEKVIAPPMVASQQETTQTPNQAGSPPAEANRPGVIRLKGDRSTSPVPSGSAKPDTATYMHIGDQSPSTSSPSTAKGSESSAVHGSPGGARSVAPSVASAGRGKSGKAEPMTALGQKMLESIEFDDVPLADAMKLFAEQAGLNVITSTEAGKTRVTVFLKQVSALDALEAIVKANGLFYRVEAASGIVRIATSKEYEKDLSSFREEQTRVFTLLYPNPIAVAQVIQQVFGNRVQMNRADADAEDLLDLSRRFNRFDMVDGRSLGLGGSNLGGGGGRAGGNNPFMGRNGLNGNGMNANAMNANILNNGLGMGGMNAFNGMNPNQPLFNNSTDKATLSDLSAEEIQRLENELAQQGELKAETQADLLQRRDATIYISTIRRNNQIIVRTGDNRSMDQIAQLITQLDVPTPTVLLEVKVLRIVLADGFNSAFEYFGGTNTASAAMSDGALQPTFPGASTAARTLGAGLGVAGGVPGSLSFQMVDDKFRVRMQLLESKNCVTALATPLILTANNEVSRIFVGDTLPFTVGFTPSQVLSSVTAVNGAVAATPVTELRDVGQSLLITPNINADRTVTLRVIEENSERVLAGSSIPVPATSGSGVTNINVDTVRRRTISGTIVAQDGMAVALGGLIEEQEHDARDQVPVLGNIPGLGLLFRRQSTGKSRSELVVIVRPYVFNTPTESAATTEMLLGELSTHPHSAEVAETTTALPCPVTRSEAESSQRAKLFQLHTRSLSSN